jgi:glycosyltransferase involved in cell wall biosynthesis
MQNILPWRLTHRGGLLNTTFLAPRRRLSLAKAIEREWARREDRVTVVIGVSRRVDYKLENTLRSICEQSLGRQNADIVVVDYNNSTEETEFIGNACARFRARHIRICDGKKWNKSRCYNIAFRRVRTKYVMSCDADIILAPSYLATAIDVLRADPLSVVYSQCLDLPRELEPELLTWHVRGSTADILRFRDAATPRSSGGMNQGISLSHSLFYQYVQGYDEFYEEWGCEDTDLQKRFYWLGLNFVTVKDKTFYLHQWHEKHASLDQGSVREALVRNEKYLQASRSIVRNNQDWGEARSQIEL